MRDRSRGQAMVLFALGIVALLAMLGLIVDGGIAYAHQRMAQNGADASANAGGVVLAQWVTNKSGPLQDSDALAAVTTTADANGLEGWTATYTDAYGANLPAPNMVGQMSDGLIPAAARGVHVTGSRAGEATFSRVIGITTVNASADATAVVGKLAGCDPASPCGLLPVTFPVTVDTCTDPHQIYFPPNNPFPNQGGSQSWPLVPYDQAVSPSGDALMASIPLCTTQASGAVGWLDLGTGQNLSQEISNPYSGSLDVPNWFQTKQGNMNNVETALNAYIGQVMLIPMWDGLCYSYPGSPAALCNDSRTPVGDNTWYHIPQFTWFKIYHAYIGGNDISYCSSAPGTPLVADVNASGFIGCIKGWFTEFITEGPISLGSDPMPGDSVGIQLIR